MDKPKNKVVDQADSQKTGETLLGTIIVTLGFVGLVSFILGVAAILSSKDYVGAGVCFVASALSFGFLLSGLARK